MEQQQSFKALRQVVVTDRSRVVDSRATGGEVIKIPILNPMQPIAALSAVADDLAWFMEQATGRGYQKTEEVYELGFIVREPGHEAYGLKVHTEEGAVVISRVALLEDDSIFKRYVDYLHSGMFI